jgi:hypothetical protein
VCYCRTFVDGLTTHLTVQPTALPAKACGRRLTDGGQKQLASAAHHEFGIIQISSAIMKQQPPWPHVRLPVLSSHSSFVDSTQALTTAHHTTKCVPIKSNDEVFFIGRQPISTPTDDTKT